MLTSDFNCDFEGNEPYQTDEETKEMSQVRDEIIESNIKGSIMVK